MASGQACRHAEPGSGVGLESFRLWSCMASLVSGHTGQHLIRLEDAPEPPQPSSAAMPIPAEPAHACGPVPHCECGAILGAIGHAISCRRPWYVASRLPGRSARRPPVQGRCSGCRHRHGAGAPGGRPGCGRGFRAGCMRARGSTPARQRERVSARGCSSGMRVKSLDPVLQGGVHGILDAAPQVQGYGFGIRGERVRWGGGRGEISLRRALVPAVLHEVQLPEEAAQEAGTA